MKSNAVEYAVTKAEFLKGIVNLEDREFSAVPEIAVVGRSNVGKSTFVNYITERSTLARVSGKPGHTREINIFSISVKPSTGNTAALILADLPGFGFARISKEQQEHFSFLTVQYIRSTPTLRAIVLLIDSHREPEDDEMAIVRTCIEEGVEIIVFATKIDRLSQSERAASVKRISSALDVEPQVISISGTDRYNPYNQFWSRVLPLL